MCPVRIAAVIRLPGERADLRQLSARDLGTSAAESPQALVKARELAQVREPAAPELGLVLGAELSSKCQRNRFCSRVRSRTSCSR